MTREPRTRSIDVALRVMDHQMVGPSGALLGNVDNLVLHHDPDGLLVAGVISGPGGLGPRQPGLLGEWIVAVWRRLHPKEAPKPLMLPMSHVRTIGPAVTVSDYAEHVLDQSSGLEQWMRMHLVSRIPGATGGQDRLAGTDIPPPAPHDELEVPTDAHLLSDLLGATVTDGAGTILGTLNELRADAFEQTGLEVGRLRVRSIVFGPHRLGGELGYTTLSDQGPWLLARGFGWWHRHDREAAWNDVARIDWDPPVITLIAGRQLQHPHTASTTTAGPG
ncbi:MAG: hypothetical protein QOE58_734 [Actinomycetota bacterium]|jgi:hypothetical protein|nr:hypothetical protein [Actinomycetota bacterium]